MIYIDKAMFIKASISYKCHCNDNMLAFSQISKLNMQCFFKTYRNCCQILFQEVLLTNNALWKMARV